MSREGNPFRRGCDPGAGCPPARVSQTPVDVLVADGHKWLLGPEACALFYVSEGARERVPPLAAGWWNIRSSGATSLPPRLPPGSGATRRERFPPQTSWASPRSLGPARGNGLGDGSERIRAAVESLKSGCPKGAGNRLARALGSGILAAVPAVGDERLASKALEKRGIIVLRGRAPSDSRPRGQRPRGGCASLRDPRRVRVPSRGTEPLHREASGVDSRRVSCGMARRCSLQAFGVGDGILGLHNGGEWTSRRRRAIGPRRPRLRVAE